uniref:protein phosphatase 2C domain-containing protein n=1 Tax=Alistipes sp. TaxID=1872444 RepID=UPI00405678BD
MKPIQFRLTAYTDPAGKWDDKAPKRGNEDDLFVDADLSNDLQGEFFTDRVQSLSDLGALMVVADGMGGTNAGEVASAIAIETVKKFFAREALTPDVVRSTATRAAYLERLVVAADSAIKSEAKRNPDCEGMGSTIVMVWLCAGQATVAWCGDSRAYLFRETQGLKQITKDHSYVQELVDKGLITEEVAFDHPMNNIITRSLGDPSKQAQPESVSVPVYKGDILMVCSDGLCGVLRDRKSYDLNGNQYPGFNMEDIIRENRSTMQGLREVLWAAAQSSDWYDNVTAILCEILEGDSPVVPPTPVEQPERKEPQKTEAPMKTKSFVSFRMRKSTLGIIVALLVVLLGAAAYFIFAPKSTKVDYTLEDRDSLMARAQRWQLPDLAKEAEGLTEDDLDQLQGLQEHLLDGGKEYFVEKLDSLQEAEAEEPLKEHYATLRSELDELSSVEQLLDLERRLAEPVAEEKPEEEVRGDAGPSRLPEAGRTATDSNARDHQDQATASEVGDGAERTKSDKGEAGSNQASDEERGAENGKPRLELKPINPAEGLTPVAPATPIQVERRGGEEATTPSEPTKPQEEPVAEEEGKTPPTTVEEKTEEKSV